MPPQRNLLLALAVTLFVMGTGLFLYMRGPANLIARPAKDPAVGYPILDGCLRGYTKQDVENRLKTWSDDQIALYRAVHLGPDMLFPWVYSGFFFVTAVLLFGRAFPRRTLWPVLVVLPVLVLAADYLENYLISFVILPAGWPVDAATVAFASGVTVTKWVLVGLNMFVIGVGGVLCRSKTAMSDPLRINHPADAHAATAPPAGR
jgi:hypothetical protein